MRPFRYESNGSVQASPGQVFAHIDDPTRLASHMCKGAWRLADGGWQAATWTPRQLQAVGKPSDRRSGCQVGSSVLSGRLKNLCFSAIHLAARSGQAQAHRSCW